MSSYYGFKELVVKNPVAKVPKTLSPPIEQLEENIKVGQSGEETVTARVIVKKGIFTTGELVFVKVVTDATNCSSELPAI